MIFREESAVDKEATAQRDQDAESRFQQQSDEYNYGREAHNTQYGKWTGARLPFRRGFSILAPARLIIKRSRQISPDLVWRASVPTLDPSRVSAGRRLSASSFCRSRTRIRSAMVTLSFAVSSAFMPLAINWSTSSSRKGLSSFWGFFVIRFIPGIYHRRHRNRRSAT